MTPPSGVRSRLCGGFEVAKGLEGEAVVDLGRW